MTLELYYPIKPSRINQVWGIYNPAYLQFGFDHHNGIDFALGDDGKLYCPIDMVIISQDYFPSGGGYMVTARTLSPYVVPHIDNQPVYIEIVFMHCKSFIHSIGDILRIGDEIAIPDNTGFSTGPHTHIGMYRINGSNDKLDTNNAEGSFDFSPYFNGKYAIDYKNTKEAISLATTVIDVAQQLPDDQKKETLDWIDTFLNWLSSFWKGRSQ